MHRAHAHGSRRRDVWLPVQAPSDPLALPATYSIVAKGRSGMHQVDALDQEGRGRGAVERVPNDSVRITITLGQACDSPRECSNPTFCDGEEQCLRGICAPGTAPCQPSPIACVQVSCVEEEEHRHVAADHRRCVPAEAGGGTEPMSCDAVLGCRAGRPKAPHLSGMTSTAALSRIAGAGGACPRRSRCGGWSTRLDCRQDAPPGRSAPRGLR